MQDCIKLKGAVTYCVPYTEVLFDQQKKLPPSGVWAVDFVVLSGHCRKAAPYENGEICSPIVSVSAVAH